MKKLGCLITLVVIIAGLIYSGIVTTDQLLGWSDQAITWTIGALEDLRSLIRGQSASRSAVKADILLVNADHPLPENYSPGPLVRLYDQKRHFLLARDDLYLTQEAFEAANRLFKAAEDEGLNGYIITSAYRSREAQQKIYQESQPGLAQKPGCSEHETGLAFDVTIRTNGTDFGDTEHCRWLLRHCHEYGFIQRYPEGKESVTGIAHEPWHYRYVGTEAARQIVRSRLTLEEYLTN